MKINTPKSRANTSRVVKKDSGRPTNIIIANKNTLNTFGDAVDDQDDGAMAQQNPAGEEPKKRQSSTS